MGEVIFRCLPHINMFSTPSLIQKASRSIQRVSVPNTPTRVVTSQPRLQRKRPQRSRPVSIDRNVSEQFCYKTEFEDFTVLESTNTDWSVFLSGHPATDATKNPATSSAFLFQLFTQLLTKSNEIPSPQLSTSSAPVLSRQGSLTGILPRKNGSSKGSESASLSEAAVPLRRQPILSLQIETHEDPHWSIGYSPQSHQVAMYMKNALEGIDISPGASLDEVPSNLERLNQVACTSPHQLVIRVPESCFEGDNAKKTASIMAEALAHPTVRPFAVESAVLSVEVDDAPKVVSVSL